MIKSKSKVISISILLVLILAPILFPLETYLQTLGIYTFAGGLLMLMVGVPVTFIAGFITTRVSRFSLLLNIILHVIPAFIVGLCLNTGHFHIESLFFIGIPVFASAIFFVVDEIIFHKKNLIKKTRKYIFLFPIAVYLLFAGPVFIKGFVAKHAAEQIKQKEVPTVTLHFNNQYIPIKSSYCWTSDGEGCVYETEPFPLPEESVDGVKEIQLSIPGTLDFQFDNSKGEPTIYAYLFDGNEKKKLKEIGTSIDLPSDIPEQGIKFVVKWDNNETIWFLIGVRTGIPTNGRTF
jgi:uncharacterized membrane protein YeaQ/YmgE (transglycosylase-associated protein family)